MVTDTNQPQPLIDIEVLRSRIKARLQTTATGQAIEALCHSLHCVLSQHLNAAWNAIRDEVADLVVKGEFEDIPALRPEHFLPSHQHLFDSPQKPRPGYEPGPRVRPRR